MRSSGAHAVLAVRAVRPDPAHGVPPTVQKRESQPPPALEGRGTVSAAVAAYASCSGWLSPRAIWSGKSNCRKEIMRKPATTEASSATAFSCSWCSSWQGRAPTTVRAPLAPQQCACDSCNAVHAVCCIVCIQVKMTLHMALIGAPPAAERLKSRRISALVHVQAGRRGDARHTRSLRLRAT